MIDKIISDEGFICNCECKCDKSFDVITYLDYENCKCRKRLIDKLVKECSENIDEKKILASVILILALKKLFFNAILLNVTLLNIKMGRGGYKVNKHSKSNKLRCNDITNFNDFDCNLLKIHKKSYEIMIFITLGISPQKNYAYEDIYSI